MAYTTTIVHKTVFGDERAIHVEVAADANSGVIDVGLSHVRSLAFSPISMASGSEAKLKRNLDASSAAVQGKVMASGFTSGDVFALTIYGR